MSAHGIESPDIESTRIVEAAGREPLARLIARNSPLEHETLERARLLAARRAAGEPLQYVTGNAGFRRLDLAVGPGVFVPRPETELVVERAMDLLPHNGRLVDVGTGSGAIALAVADERADARVYATESSAEALYWARRNLAITGLEIELLEGDLLAPLPHELRGAFDVVVANPPYVASYESLALPRDVVEHEPHDALFATAAGLAVIERLADDAPEWLGPNGHLILEIGAHQAEAVRQLCDATAYRDVTIEPDMAGRERIAVARRPADERLGAAIRGLDAGGIVVVPTETVYGLGARLDHVERLFEAKGRPPSKPIPVLAASVEALEPVAAFDETARRLGERFWPGPLTLVLPRAPGFDAPLAPATTASVAVRVPAQALLAALLRRTGPLAVTSANRSGEPPATTLEEARAVFGARAFYLGSGATKGSPSTIVSLVGPRPVILRRGALDDEALLSALSPSRGP